MKSKLKNIEGKNEEENKSKINFPADCFLSGPKEFMSLLQKPFS